MKVNLRYLIPGSDNTSLASPTSITSAMSGRSKTKFLSFYIFIFLMFMYLHHLQSWSCKQKHIGSLQYRKDIYVWKICYARINLGIWSYASLYVSMNLNLHRCFSETAPKSFDETIKRIIKLWLFWKKNTTGAIWVNLSTTPKAFVYKLKLPVRATWERSIPC